MKKSEPKKPIQYAALSPEYPTRLELCNLAAALANGQTVHIGNAKELVAQADTLWQASGDFLARVEIRSRHKSWQTEQAQKFAADMVRAKAYPVRLPEILRLLVSHKKKVEERTEVWKMFVRDCLHKWRAFDSASRPDANGRTVATPQEVVTELKRQATEGLTQERFIDMADAFKRWRAETSKPMLTERARTGGKAKAAKKVENTRLTQ